MPPTKRRWISKLHPQSEMRHNQIVEPNSRPPSTRFSLASISTLVTVAAALLYPLGLIALTVQLSLRFFHDFPVALYAASLVPWTIVLGQLPGGLWNVNVLGAVAGIVLGFVNALFRESVGPVLISRLSRSRVPAVSWLGSALARFLTIEGRVVVGVLGIAAIVVLFAGSSATWLSPLLWLYMTAIVGSAFGMLSYTMRWPIRIVSLLVFAYVLAFVNVSYNRPPLPPIEITVSGAAGPKVIRGVFLAHTAEYWHVIIEPADIPGPTMLQSIPDRETQEIVMRPRHPTPEP